MRNKVSHQLKEQVFRKFCYSCRFQLIPRSRPKFPSRPCVSSYRYDQEEQRQEESHKKAPSSGHCGNYISLPSKKNSLSTTLPNLNSPTFLTCHGPCHSTQNSLEWNRHPICTVAQREMPQSKLSHRLILKLNRIGHLFWPVCRLLVFSVAPSAPAIALFSTFGTAFL